MIQRVGKHQKRVGSFSGILGGFSYHYSSVANFFGFRLILSRKQGEGSEDLIFWIVT